MSPIFARKLGLHIPKTNVRTQKIDSSTLKIFGIMIADFQVEDKGSTPRFFQETFLVTDTKFEVILGMLFLKISITNMAFSEEIITWKFYNTYEALPIIEQVQLVDPKKFVIVALDADSKIFIVYMAI